MPDDSVRTGIASLFLGRLDKTWSLGWKTHTIHVWGIEYLHLVDFYGNV